MDGQTAEQVSDQGAASVDSAALLNEVDSWASVTPAKVNEFVEENGLVPSLILFAGDDSFFQAFGGDDQLFGVGDKEHVNSLIKTSDNNREVFGAILLQNYAGEVDRYDGSDFNAEDPRLRDWTVGQDDIQRLIDNPDTAAAHFNGVNAVFDTFKTQADWEAIVGSDAATLQDLQSIDTSKLNSDQKDAVQGAIDHFHLFNSGYTFSDTTIDFDDIERHRANLRSTEYGGNNSLDAAKVAEEYKDQTKVERNAKIQASTTKEISDRNVKFTDDLVSFEVQSGDTIFDLVNKEIRAMNEIAGSKVIEEVQPGADIYNHPFALDLAEYNDITNMDLIYPGQPIRIPKSYLEKYIAGMTPSSGPR